MAIDILVYGWYGKGNVGDELMSQALIGAFAPHDARLTIVDTLTDEAVDRCDAVIFGGGSILYGRPIVGKKAMELLVNGKRPVFYVGVGTETQVHDDHRRLLDVARMVVVRNPVAPDWMNRVRHVPDLVYSLPSAPISDVVPNGLIIVPNVEVVPTHDSPHWVHLGWERFKDETAQFLDQLVEEGTRPTFLLMCKNKRVDDAWAMDELIARMKHRSTEFEVLHPGPDSLALTDVMQRFEVVVTQRYHGIVLAQMAGVPCVSIHHHDKLKLAWPRKGVDLAYHGLVKSQLEEARKIAKSSPRERIGSAKELYDRLVSDVVDVIEISRRTRGEPICGGT